MRRMRRTGWNGVGTVLIAALVLAWGLTLAGCGGGQESDAAKTTKAGPLRIVTTTGQVGDLARRVGGERVDVITLMGPGIDPHLYKASAGDVERLRRADLILSNGLHLEAKLGEVLERLARTVAVAEAIPAADLISPPEFSGAHDPHVWFAVPLWLHALDATTEALIAHDAEHADEYRERAAVYRRELEDLDAYVRTQIASIPAERRVLVTAHDAFNYFGRAYGMEVRGLQGISTATEAGTADVQDLAATIAQRRIPAIFVESSVSPKAIEAVQAAVRSRGFDVVVGGSLFSDALGDAGTPTGTYVGTVRHNVDTIVAALADAVEKEHHADR